MADGEKKKRGFPQGDDLYLLIRSGLSRPNMVVCFESELSEAKELNPGATVKRIKVYGDRSETVD